MCPATLDLPSSCDDVTTAAATLVMLHLTAQLLMPVAEQPNRRPRHRRASALAASGVARTATVVRQAQAPAITAFNARPRPRLKVVLDADWWSPT